VDRSINSGVPFGKAGGGFWRAGQPPGRNEAMPRQQYWTSRTEDYPASDSEILHRLVGAGPRFAARHAVAAAASLNRWHPDENLDGLFARINLQLYGRVAEVDFVASSFRSSNDGGRRCPLDLAEPCHLRNYLRRFMSPKMRNHGIGPGSAFVIAELCGYPPSLRQAPRHALGRFVLR
jgi:hypothetical protein